MHAPSLGHEARSGNAAGVSGTIARKTLSQRTHRCACGVVADRDLFAGYLVRHVDPMVHPHLLDVDGAKAAWTAKIAFRWRTCERKRFRSRISIRDSIGKLKT